MSETTKEQVAYERGYKAGFEAAQRAFGWHSLPGSPMSSCNCDPRKQGSLTGGWVCPVHGQQF